MESGSSQMPFGKEPLPLSGTGVHQVRFRSRQLNWCQFGLFTNPTADLPDRLENVCKNNKRPVLLIFPFAA